jgi:HEAT repeat protein
MGYHAVLSGGKPSCGEVDMNMHGRGVTLSAAAVAAVVFFGLAGTGWALEDIEGTMRIAVSPGRVGSRLEAINRLGAVSEPRIVEEWNLVDVLLGLADNPNPRLAHDAIQGLGNYARGVQRRIAVKIIDPLMGILKDKERHPLARRAAITELGKTLKAGELTHREAIGKIVSVAGDTSEEPEVRQDALLGLGQIGSVKAKGVIVKGLGDRDDLVSEAAFEAFWMVLGGPSGGDFIDPRTGSTLTTALASSKTSVGTKMNVLKIMGIIIGQYKFRGISDRPVIKLLEDSDDPDLVVAALVAISYMGTEKAAEGIESAYERFKDKPDLGAKATEVRTEVCATAGSLFDYWSQLSRLKEGRKPLPTRAPKTLTELLSKILMEDPEAGVKREAAVSLGNLYDRGYDKREAVKILIVVVGHEEMGEEIKRAALKSLEVLTGKNFGYDVEKWEAWYIKYKQKLAPKRER